MYICIEELLHVDLYRGATACTSVLRSYYMYICIEELLHVHLY